MTIDQLREIHHAAPFRPFTIHTGDGKAIRVPHSDFMSFSQSGRSVFVSGENDSYSIIDVRLATQVEVHEAASK